MNAIWKSKEIIRLGQNSFIVIHSSPVGELPYNVCPRENDPANLYDVAEIAAFWNSLPDDDPRKQMYTPPEPEEPEAMQEDDTVVE